MEQAIEQIIRVLLVFLVGIFSWVIKSLRQEIKETRTQLDDLRVELPSSYVHKNDFNSCIDRICDKLDRIEHKIDSKADKGG